MTVDVPVVCGFPLEKSLVESLHMMRFIRLNQNVALLESLDEVSSIVISNELKDHLIEEESAKESVRIKIKEEIELKIALLKNRISENSPIHFDEIEFFTSLFTEQDELTT